MSDPERLKKYDAFKRENDEHLLISLTNLFPHDDCTDTVRANIALEIYGQKFTIAHLLKNWTERHKEIDKIYRDLNRVPDTSKDNDKAIRKAAVGNAKKSSKTQY